MAPKNKFTREEMVTAAVVVVRKGGEQALTAKALAEALGTSTQPVFTCFGTMEALKAEVYAAAEQIFNRYALAGLQQKVPFFGYGVQYIRFAREEPELYRILFLTKRAENTAINTMRRMSEAICPVLMRIYKLTAVQANRYFRDVWLTAHSLATLLVTGNCPYSDGEIARILTGCSLSTLTAIKQIPGFAEDSFDRDAAFKSVTGQE